MSTLTIHVSDFTSMGLTPRAHARFTFEPYRPVFGTTELLTADPWDVVTDGSGDATSPLPTGVALWVKTNVPGLPFRILVAGFPADVSLADLYSKYQVDEATLQPLDPVPVTLQEMLAHAEQILEEVTWRTVTAAVDPNDPRVLVLTFPVYRLDPNNPLILPLPVQEARP